MLSYISKYQILQVLQSSIVKDVSFTIITQDWNEYVVDDGTTIKIKPLVVKIAKTSKFDSNGFPKYICEISGNMEMEAPVSWIHVNDCGYTFNYDLTVALEVFWKIWNCTFVIDSIYGWFYFLYIYDNVTNRGNLLKK